jgi:cysteine desulfurase / selenocysteine lyase
MRLMTLENIRSQFPFFTKHPDTIFLDTAASAQKPAVVIDGIKNFYESSYANIHRGAYPLADQATTLYETARKQVQVFLSAENKREIIFTKNATESINLVVRSFADGGFLQKNDTVILSEMEHHANIIPWLQLKERIGIHIEYIPIDKNKNLDLQAYKKLLEIHPVKLVAVTHVSNVLGTINDVKTICQMAKEHKALSLIDGCQAAPHFPVNVQDLDCDLYVCSAHKIYGPTGIGILYGRLPLLKKLPPFLGGGDMIHEVFFDSFTPNEVPYKFEAGTPPITEAYACGIACVFLLELDMKKVFQHDKALSEYAYQQFLQIPEVTIYSHPNACGLISFSVQGINDYDIGDALGDEGICVRVGHHCAQPLLDNLKVSTLIRASFGIYSTKEDIDICTQTLKKIIIELQ